MTFNVFGHVKGMNLTKKQAFNPINRKVSLLRSLPIFRRNSVTEKTTFCLGMKRPLNN